MIISSNWGFEQGGGFRQGNFIGQDKQLSVVTMSFNQSTKQLAVAGAMGDKWAVRVYQLGMNGPNLITSWTNQQKMEFFQVTSMEWVSAEEKLVCAVEHFSG